MALITYEQAITHLNQTGVLDGSPNDQDVLDKMEEATAIVLGHLKRFGEWSVDTDATTDSEFAVVRAVIKEVLANLYRFRGDDENAPDVLTPRLIRLLDMYRDGAIA